MKFNALLEWLQTQIAGPEPKVKEVKKDKKAEKANTIKAEKALRAERQRDGSGTSTEDAPKAEPEPVAEEAVMKDTMGGAPADPLPEDEADTGAASDARKTVSHEEL
jgi:hypothetical protein